MSSTYPFKSNNFYLLYNQKWKGFRGWSIKIVHPLHTIHISRLFFFSSSRSLLRDIAREFRFAVDSGGPPTIEYPRPVSPPVARLNFRTIVETRVSSRTTREFNFLASERASGPTRINSRPPDEPFSTELFRCIADACNPSVLSSSRLCLTTSRATRFASRDFSSRETWDIFRKFLFRWNFTRMCLRGR